MNDETGGTNMKTMHEMCNRTAQGAALAAALSGCAGGPPLTAEEAYYQREHNLRVFQMISDQRASRENASAIRSLRCIGNPYCN